MRNICISVVVSLLLWQLPLMAQYTTGFDARQYRQILYVAVDHPDARDLEGYGSKHHPMRSLWYALTRISDAAESQRYAVCMASGTYTGVQTYATCFTLKPWVDVYGGYDHWVWSRDINKFPTILDGENSHQVVLAASHSRLDGVRITQGSAIAGIVPQVDVWGGGIRFDNTAESVLSNSVIEKNTAVNGGGLACRGSSPEIHNCLIRENQAFGGVGGGLCCWDGSSPILRNCTFLDNGSLTNGGAIYCRPNTAPTLVNSTLAGNSAIDAGGISGLEASPNLLNCILWGNPPRQIKIVDGNPTLDHCAIQGGWSGAGNNNLALDPGFVAPGGPNLKPDSPCRDQGIGPAVNPLVPQEDFEGQRRSGDTSDIGADEIQGEGPAPTPTWTATAGPANTPTLTATQSPTASNTPTSTTTLSPTSSETPTWTGTPTSTPTPTDTLAIDSVPPEDFVDYLLMQSVTWGSDKAGQRMDAATFCESYRQWRQHQVSVLQIQHIGVAGGTVAVTSEALHGTVALEVPPNSLIDDLQIVLERIPNPQTDSLGPTIRLRFPGQDGKTARKWLTGSTTWPIRNSFDLSFAKQWTNDLANDVKIAVRKVGEEVWTVVDTTVDITRGVARATLHVTEEIIQTGIEIVIVVTGPFYRAYFQSEGFFTVTTPYGGTADLHAALHPQPGEKVLVLVHGIFSSPEAFTEKPEDFPESLRDYYDHIIFARYRSCQQEDWWRFWWSPCCSSRAARILWNNLTSQFDDGGDAFTKAEVHLVGHSQGGIVCRWFIEELPKRDSKYRKLMEKGMIDRFLTLDSPNGGLLEHQFCSWIALWLTGSASCAILNLGAEGVLGTIMLNDSIDLRGIPTYCIGVKGGVVIPDSSALDLPVGEDRKLLISNSTHIRAHEEMRTNGVFDSVFNWFCLADNCFTPTSGTNIGTLATGSTISLRHGDDGYYQMGRRHSYTNHGNGTVTDNNTGLMWVRDPDAAGVGGVYSWNQALQVCRDLNYAGHSDWRLPTVQELVTLRDAGRYNPSIDPVFVCRSSDYWSSTVYARYTDHAWDVDFDLGNVNWYYQTLNFYVRPVRVSP